MKPKSKIYSRYFTYIKPVAKIPVVKTYGSIIFSLFIITFFIFYAVKPTIETILVLQKKLEDSTTVLEKVNLKARNLSQAKQNYEGLEENFKSRFDTAIPDTVNLRSVIQTLEKSALEHQASISALQVQPLVIDSKNEDVLGTLTQIAFNFNVAGKYQDLIAMLQDLKSSGRLISIEGLTLSTSLESGLVMSISGKAYYIK